MRKGNLFVVSGPSGAGKSTICKLVRERLGLHLSVSATTRAPRAGEVQGAAYYFMDEEEFLRRKNRGEFLETALVHGHYYGTLLSEVEKYLDAGEDVVLEIDVQGGLQVKEKYPRAKMVFFKAPSEKELEERLLGRGADSGETIRLRLENALRELTYEDKYETTVVNHTVEQACADLIAIIRNEKES
ncbi:MAG: guanylate kinase [Fusobacteriaceae bacterium]|jgi:guanylate kinase|nr:guanylate kinase [Fusobacteriaceae bacterium]